VATSNKIYQDQDQAAVKPIIIGAKLDDTDLLQYYGGSEMISFQNDLTEILSSVQHISSDSTAYGPDVLKPFTKAISLAKDRINDLQLSASMPSHLQGILVNALDALTNVETYVQKTDELVSKYSSLGGIGKTSMSPTHPRILSSNQDDLSTKHQARPGVTKADYHSRAKSHQMGHGHPFDLGNHFVHHQQGYHGARVSRGE